MRISNSGRPTFVSATAGVRSCVSATAGVQHAYQQQRASEHALTRPPVRQAPPHPHLPSPQPPANQPRAAGVQGGREPFRRLHAARAAGRHAGLWLGRAHGAGAAGCQRGWRSRVSARCAAVCVEFENPDAEVWAVGRAVGCQRAAQLLT
eukprot:121202-Chlamydomonas_euryale.AAC.5